MVNQVGNELQAAIVALDAHDTELVKLKLMRAVIANDVLDRRLKELLVPIQPTSLEQDQSFLAFANTIVDRAMGRGAAAIVRASKATPRP